MELYSGKDKHSGGDSTIGGSAMGELGKDEKARRGKNNNVKAFAQQNVPGADDFFDDGPSNNQ